MFKKTLSFALVLTLGMFTYPTFAAEQPVEGFGGKVDLRGNTQTTTPEPSSGSVVGVWSVTPKLKPGEVKEWIELRSDGTFTYYNFSTRKLGYFPENNTFTRIGRYTVSDGKIHCTNIIDNLDVTAGSPSGNQSYKNKTYPDSTWLYRFTTKEFNRADYGNPENYVDVLWLEINFSPNDPELNKYTGFAKPF